MNNVHHSPLMQRVMTGGVLLILFLAALFLLPPIAWACLMLLILIGAAFEAGRLLSSEHFAQLGIDASPHYRWLLPMALFTAAVFLALGAWRFTQVELISLSCACYFAALLVSLFALPFWIARFERRSLKLSSFLRGSFAIACGWLMFCGWLASVQLRVVSPWALLTILVLIWLADSAAYFSGRAFGKNKLAPQTSPGKTREGVLGALAAATVYALATAPFILPHFPSLHALPIVAQWGIWIALVWLLTILSVIGDLFESLLKRLADYKDSSHLLPGHGGIYDRIDSLLTTLPVAALALFMLV
jgi:CDP-diglyceride synthetase